jgi:hypothetical protein
MTNRRLANRTVLGWLDGTLQARSWGPFAVTPRPSLAFSVAGSGQKMHAGDGNLLNLPKQLEK